MAKYLVEAPHTAEQCLTALDEVLARGSGLLNEFEWGCKSGVHTGWAILDADSESAVQARLPSTQSGSWRVTKLTKFTPEDIRAAHQQ